MTMVEERVSKLEGAYEQVHERLGDLTTAVASLRTDMDAKFDALRSDMDAKFDAQRGEIASLRSDMDAKFDAQRAEISAFRSEVSDRLNNMTIAIATVSVALGGAVVFLALRV